MSGVMVLEPCFLFLIEWKHRFHITGLKRDIVIKSRTLNLNCDHNFSDIIQIGLQNKYIERDLDVWLQYQVWCVAIPWTGQKRFQNVQKHSSSCEI